MMTKIGPKPRDHVDLAMAGVERAINKLIGLLGSEDEAVGQKALGALLGRFHSATAVAYLGEALRRSRGDTRLRRRIALALAAIGQRVREPATMTLIALLMNEESEAFSVHLTAALASLGPASTTPI